MYNKKLEKCLRKQNGKVENNIHRSRKIDLLIGLTSSEVVTNINHYKIKKVL